MINTPSNSLLPSQQPASWNYSIDSVGISQAFYPGDVAINGALTNNGVAYATEAELAAAVALLQSEIAQSPPFIVTSSFQAWGDSTVAGVGTSTSPINYSFPGQLSTQIFSGGTVTNNGVGGQKSAAMVTLFTAASPTVRGQTQIVSTGLNDFLLAPITRTWASADFTLNNIIAFQAQIVGGALLCVVNTMRQDTNSIGMQNGADTTWFNRRALATFNADAINVSAYMDEQAQTIGPDYYNVTQNAGVPPTMMGTSVNLVSINNAPFITVAGVPADLSYSDGQVAWNSVALAWYMKNGASGIGSWIILDIKHKSQHGYAQVAAIVRNWIQASEGTGPPFAPPQSFYCASDIAAAALVGRIAIRTAASNLGQADTATIVSGNPAGNPFSIDPFGNIRRSNSGALASQKVVLTIRLGITISGGTFTRDSIVNIFVGSASTQLLPVLSTITAPISLYGMEGHNMPDSKQLSGAVWINCTNLSTQPYLMNWTIGLGGLLAQMIVSMTYDAATGTGKFHLQIIDGTNATIALATSKAQNNGGVGIPGNTSGFLVWALDLNAGTLICYWNESALTFTAPGSFTFANTISNFSQMSPLMMNGRKVYGADRIGSLPFAGKLGLFAVWSQFIDWTVAGTRRLLYNADGTPAITDHTCTILGNVAAMVPWYGNVIDMMYGGLNQSAGNIVQPTAAALTTVTTP